MNDIDYTPTRRFQKGEFLISRFRNRKVKKLTDHSKYTDEDFPPIDIAAIGHGVDIENVALQRRINGFAAELRVLVQIDGVWHVAIHEMCAGNLNKMRPTETIDND
jgi:hypothetical protein